MTSDPRTEAERLDDAIIESKRLLRAFERLVAEAPPPDSGDSPEAQKGSLKGTRPSAKNKPARK